MNLEKKEIIKVYLQLYSELLLKEQQEWSWENTLKLKFGFLQKWKIQQHGVLMIKGPYSGLLLPQVATQYNWDRQTFLSEACHKAGLPADAWTDDETEIYIFSAEIF